MTLLEFPHMGRPSRPTGRAPVASTNGAEEKPEGDEAAQKPVDPVYQYFANALRAARAQRGMTQMQLAVKAEVSLGSVHLVESARQNPTLKSLATLAEAVDLKVGDLLPQSIPEAEEKRRAELSLSMDAELDAVQAQLQQAVQKLERLRVLSRQLREDRGEGANPV